GGRMADTRLVIGVVGAREGAKLAEQIRAFVGHLGRAEPVNRIRARVLPDVENLVAELVDRLFPGDARPLAVAELHRILQAALAGDELAHRSALGAMRAAVDRRIPARLLADPDAVPHLGADSAADRAVRADVLPDGGAGGHHGSGRIGLTHTRQRQRAESGKTAG